MDRRTAPIPQYKWGTRRQSLALVLLFSVAVSFPLVGCLFHWQGASLVEIRPLEAWPDFRNTPIKDLPAKIDAYYSDHVGFRKAVIGLSGEVLHRFLKAPSEDVVIGRPLAPGQRPWYFCASEGILEDRLGMDLFTPGQLEAWRSMLEERSAWLGRRGAIYLFVVVPEKSSIYPELLPDYIRSHMGRTRLDQLSEYLTNTRSRASFLDLRPPLQQAKSQGVLYFPFDTHWNGRGVFHGYEAILDALRVSDPRLTAGHLGQDFEIRDGPESFRTDLAAMLGLRETSATPLLAKVGPTPSRLATFDWPSGIEPPQSSDHALYALETPEQRGRLLMFHDSAFVAPLFSWEPQPLGARVAKSTFVWLAPSDASFKRFVEMENPDIVVEERVERVLRRVPQRPAASALR